MKTSLSGFLGCLTIIACLAFVTRTLINNVKEGTFVCLYLARIPYELRITQGIAVVTALTITCISSQWVFQLILNLNIVPIRKRANKAPTLSCGPPPLSSGKVNGRLIHLVQELDNVCFLQVALNDNLLQAFKSPKTVHSFVRENFETRNVCPLARKA